MTDDDDYQIEDILGNLEKKEGRKKKTHSKRKGNSGERDLVNSLKERFVDKTFFRVVGSGARTSQVETNENKAMFTGDIVCPANFRFTIECKYGYDDVELWSFFTDGNKQVDKWLKQAQRDADSLGRLPLLCWRKPRNPWLSFVPLAAMQSIIPQPDYQMRYRGYGIASLNSMLALPNEFWFLS